MTNIQDLPENDPLDIDDLQEELEYALEGLRLAQQLNSPYLIHRAECAVAKARALIALEFGSPDDDTESDLGE